MPALRKALTEPGPNLGLMMRWTCGLTEMEAFNAHQGVYLPQIPVWVQGVREAVARSAPYLELLEDEGQQADGHMGGWNTVCVVAPAVLLSAAEITLRALGGQSIYDPMGGWVWVGGMGIAWH